MKNWLKLRIEKDEDGTGELFAEVQSGGFGGNSSAWFELAAIESFAKELQRYPLSHSSKPLLRGGLWSGGPPSKISEEHLLIEAYPIGVTGTIGVKVRLAPLLVENRQDSLHQVTVELKTSYADLSRFSVQLGHLVAGQVVEATLHATA